MLFASEKAKPFSVKRAALAATVGNMLEFYDFITYSFFAIQIGHIVGLGAMSLMPETAPVKQRQGQA